MTKDAVPEGPSRPVAWWRRAGRLLNPVAAGRQVCRPSRPDRVHDPVVRRIQLLRMVVGFVAIVWILAAYRLASDPAAVASRRFDQAADLVALLAVTFPVTVGAFVVASRPHLRRLYLRRSLKPLGALLALGGAVAYVALLASGALTEGEFWSVPERDRPGADDDLAVAYHLFLSAVAVWAVVFLFYGTGLALAYMFRTADVHEILPPVIAVALTWENAVQDLVTNPYAGAPAAVRFVATFGGPLSITAVSIWETRRLRTRHGRTLRRALGR
ncbi:hypothetical protein ABZ901_33955 [Actinacidiphila alni]|uniref:hypothetical protein n=1 Tax=Actinacidiphila alni TaxID=380248 RepID=UPI0033E243AA